MFFYKLIIINIVILRFWAESVFGEEVQSTGLIWGDVFQSDPFAVFFVGGFMTVANVAENTLGFTISV